jgi:dTDP-4-dehydrorhamnose reductase
VTQPVRVLVTGAKGQVGVDLTDVLRGATPLGGDELFQPDGRSIGEHEFVVVGLGHSDLDITDRDAVLRTVADVAPDVIVHLAAYTAVDRAEVDAQSCFSVNATGTESMSLAAKQSDAHLITISTDYVFDGLKGDAYVEHDAANPLNVYGASKFAGELLCDDIDTVVRTSWVMGVRGRNVVHVIAERAAAGQTVKFVDDQMGTVTVASDLARSLVTLIRERPGGTWHVANSGTLTWYDVAAYVGSLCDRSDGFATPITTADLDPAPLATRPARSDLSTAKFASHWIALPSWRDGVARLVRDRALRDGSMP